MIVCSACLAGMACKYNGKNNNIDPRVAMLVDHQKAVPVCPEMLGGLCVPRIPCEIKDGRVINQVGKDMTHAFITGAKKALAITQAIGATQAILMPRSPSCGIGEIYDGSFQKRLIEGDGLFARLLREQGILVDTPDSYFEKIKIDDVEENE